MAEIKNVWEKHIKGPDFWDSKTLNLTLIIEPFIRPVLFAENNKTYWLWSHGEINMQGKDYQRAFGKSLL